MQLTRTLLRLDFDLKILLPDDRLCPPVSDCLQHLVSTDINKYLGGQPSQLYPVA